MVNNTNKMRFIDKVYLIEAPFIVVAFLLSVVNQSLIILFIIGNGIELG